MMREQYQEYDEDYRRKNAVSKIKIRESPKKNTYSMRQDERHKGNQKSLNLAYQKIAGWKMTICKSQEEKLEKQ